MHIHLQFVDVGMSDAGVGYLCDALVHPDGPKHITKLSLTSESMCFSSKCRCSPRSETTVNGIGFEGAKSICDVLVHPNGPKAITEISLGRLIFLCVLIELIYLLW